MDFERRDYELAPELRMDGEQSKISGYATVFNSDSHDLGGFVEQVRPGAFKRLLNSGANVLGLFNHEMDNLLATRKAGTLRLEEDAVGLRYEFDLDESDPDHQRVIAKVRRGDLRGSSFAFRSNKATDGWETTEDDYPRRIVNEVSALRDVGPVTSPAYGSTEDIGKSLALRSLADMVDRPVEDLVTAEVLSDFLRSVAVENNPSEDAAAETDAAATEPRTIPPDPGPAPDWHAQYHKE